MAGLTVSHRQGRGETALFSRLFGATRQRLPILGGQEPTRFVVRMRGEFRPPPAFLGLAQIFLSAFHGAALLMDRDPNRRPDSQPAAAGS